MNRFGPGPAPASSFRPLLLLLIGIAGLAMCLTLLFLSMRAVMDIGGACADGGPYVSRQSCPSGVPLAMIGGIFGLFAFGGLATAGGVQVGGRYGGIVFLAWPALFLSLGWNFLEYGIRPPGGDGPDIGWLVCGVVFVLMGALPLLALLPSRSSARRDPLAMRRLLVDLQARQRQMAPRTQPSDDGAPAPVRMDLTSRLERLAALHAHGQLSEAEFDEAKRRVIAEVAAGR